MTACRHVCDMSNAKINSSGRRAVTAGVTAKYNTLPAPLFSWECHRRSLQKFITARLALIIQAGCTQLLTP